MKWNSTASWLNLPTEQALILKDHKDSLYDQLPQVGKQEEWKVAKP